MSDNNYELRSLECEDYNKGYLELLSQCSNVEWIEEEDFNIFVDAIKKSKYFHHILVIEDKLNSKIVASGTLFSERKLINNNESVGHIEDIIIHKDYKGIELEKKLLNSLVGIGKNLYCKRIVLNSSLENANFYESNGFNRNGIKMIKYF